MYDYWNEMSQQINAESSENEIGLKVIVKRTLQRACKMVSIIIINSVHFMYIIQHSDN